MKHQNIETVDARSLHELGWSEERREQSLSELFVFAERAIRWSWGKNKRLWGRALRFAAMYSRRPGA